MDESELVTSVKTWCAHKWKQYTPAVITTHLIQKYIIKIYILPSCATQVGIFGHQRAENEARNTNMDRGQETHPLRVNASYVMNGTNSFF